MGDGGKGNQSNVAKPLPRRAMVDNGILWEDRSGDGMERRREGLGVAGNSSRQRPGEMVVDFMEVGGGKHLRAGPKPPKRTRAAQRRPCNRAAFAPCLRDDG